MLRKYAPSVNGICHITGGGRENLNRLMGENLNLRPRWNDDWTKPPEFEFIQKNGKISDGEMRNKPSAPIPVWREQSRRIICLLGVSSGKSSKCMSIKSLAFAEHLVKGRIILLIITY